MERRQPSPILLVAVLLVVAGLAVAWTPASAYLGSLSSFADPSEIVGTGEWGADGGELSLAWNIVENAGLWHYSYTFSHPEGETQEFILEAADEFGAGSVLAAFGGFAEYEVGDFEIDEEALGSESVHGIRFFGAAGTTTLIAFDSFAAPVWGDFYAGGSAAPSGGGGEKDNQFASSAWNAGLFGDDGDPEVPAGDGSLELHLLVPGTPAEVPEPASAWLVGVVVFGAAVAARRVRRSGGK